MEIHEFNPSWNALWGIEFVNSDGETSARLSGQYLPSRIQLRALVQYREVWDGDHSEGEWREEGERIRITLHPEDIIFWTKDADWDSADEVQVSRADEILVGRAITVLSVINPNHEFWFVPKYLLEPWKRHEDTSIPQAGPWPCQTNGFSEILAEAYRTLKRPDHPFVAV